MQYFDRAIFEKMIGSHSIDGEFRAKKILKHIYIL